MEQNYFTETTRVTKKWGSETWMVNTDKFCGKILSVDQGKYCSMHYHKLKEENFYVLNGSIKLVLIFPGRAEDECHPVELVLERGASVLVKPGVLHRFTGLGVNNLIIETSTQHFEEDSYRTELSGP